MLAVLRRTLSYRISIEDLIELAMWLTIPHIIIGVIWAFFHPGQVEHFEALLETRVPAGADLMAFGLAIGLWPVLVIAPVLCGA